jgi:hypothetical protein
MGSFLILYRMDVGFDPSRQLMGTMLAPEEQYATSEARVAFFERLEERLGALAGVEAVTFSTNPPLGGGAARRLAIEGEAVPIADSAAVVTSVSISTGYFDAFGLRLLAGRRFDTRDGEPGRENVIVNQQFANTLLKGSDPNRDSAPRRPTSTASPLGDCACLRRIARVPHPREASPVRRQSIASRLEPRAPISGVRVNHG